MTPPATALEFFAFHAPVTRSLRSLVLSYEQTLGNDEFVNLLDHIGELLVQAKTQLGQLTPGRERAREIHARVEREIDSVEPVPTTCKKGCAACCHLEVEITNEEALVLSDLIVKGHHVDFNRLAAQANRRHQDSAWKTRVSEDNRCVFLGSDNACSVYESRPATCRRHSVVSPVEFCEDPSKDPEVRHIPKVDILMSALMSLKGVQFGSLSRMVATELQKRPLPSEVDLNLPA